MGGGGLVKAPENVKAGHDAVGGVVPHLHQPFRNLERNVRLESKINVTFLKIRIIRIQTGLAKPCLF
jgi:hypothetical protein